MLSEFQRRVASVVAGLPEARGFALAGGAALVVQGLTDRATNDLDYFTTAPADIPVLHAALEHALAEAGFIVKVLRSSATFVRLAVSDDENQTLVDLAWDARMLPPVATTVGAVLDQDELAADKVLALFGRGEPRDFLDVYALSQRLGLDRIVDLAQQKDAGFSAERLAESLGRFDRLDRADFDTDAAFYRELRAWVTQVRRSLEGRSPPKRRGRRL